MRKIWVILDVETLGDARKVLDVGWIVCNSRGHELERFNACVSEVVNTSWGAREIAADQFTRRKLADGTRKSDWYLQTIASGEMPVLSFAAIRAKFQDLASKYRAHVVLAAYNSAFDVPVLDANAEVYGLGEFLPKSDKRFSECDLMHLAISSICNTRKYAGWATANGFVTERGSIRTNAETVFAYLTGNLGFEERHTALADCEIERDIWRACRKRKRKTTSTRAMPVSACKEWRQLQAKR